jgi:hypothetical protein
VRRWVGTPDAVELGLGLPASFDVTRDDIFDFYGEDDDMVCEEDVMRVAIDGWETCFGVMGGVPPGARGTLGNPGCRGVPGRVPGCGRRMGSTTV